MYQHFLNRFFKHRYGYAFIKFMHVVEKFQINILNMFVRKLYHEHVVSLKCYFPWQSQLDTIHPYDKNQNSYSIFKNVSICSWIIYLYYYQYIEILLSLSSIGFDIAKANILILSLCLYTKNNEKRMWNVKDFYCDKCSDKKKTRLILYLIKLVDFRSYFHWKMNKVSFH